MKTGDEHTNGRTGRTHDPYKGESTDGPVERLTVAEAARRLGVTPDALRKRIKRETIRHDTDQDGKIHVYVDSAPTVWRRVADKSAYGSGDASRDESTDAVQEEVVDVLREQLDYMRRQLDQANERDRENRRIIAGLVQRVPELEAPGEKRVGTETVSEDSGNGAGGDDPQEPTQRRSWWRRFFGFE